MPLYPSLIPFPSRSRPGLASRTHRSRSPATATILRVSPAAPKRQEQTYGLFDAIELAVDRIEKALAEDDLELTNWQYAALLKNAFPELYREPPVPELPTDTPIGTPDRLAVYSRRVSAGRSAFHPADTKPDLLGRRNLLLGGIVNQSSFRVVGWENDIPIPETGTCGDCGMDLPPQLVPGYCRCGI